MLASDDRESIASDPKRVRMVLSSFPAGQRLSDRFVFTLLDEQGGDGGR